MSTIEKLKKLADLEEKYAVELEKEYRGYGNDVVRQLLSSVMVDSKKHAGLYRTAVSLLEGKSLSIKNVEFDELEKQLKLHIEKEQEMLEASKELMEEVEDERVKKLLSWIYEDELFHHPMLKVLLDAVIKRGEVSEQELWKALFRDLPPRVPSKGWGWRPHI